ncbi:hypothetical protein SAMN05421852_10724 [Thermoflavimicrobium dichotomicum]|uniref:Repeat domain-containing protein n=2 Tax=Thermoflavimicrobium dichotomicum TaxID=46223 RepID=A0A1I3Q682_9BACL|nr:hypothetical protein SAMN05421852_10724 [Thermoflavimicrobium dichotomicum]
MMNRIALIFVWGCLCILPLGCQAFFADQPNPSNAEINEQLKKYLPADAQWLQMDDGKMKNTKRICKDIDGDGTREGIGFFVSAKKPKQIGILMVRKQETGKWSQMIWFEEGTNLAYADFQNLTGDEQLELVLGIDGIKGNAHRVVLVYGEWDRQRKRLLRKNVHEIAVGDLDHDQLSDLMLLTKEPNKKRVRIEVYQGLVGQLLVFDRMYLRADSMKVRTWRFGHVDQKRTGLFLQFSVYHSKNQVHILIMEKGKLRDLSSIPIIQQQLNRMWIVSCEDVNQDGMIEFLVKQQASHRNEHLPSPKIEELLIYSWFQLTKENQFRLLDQFIDNRKFGYQFYFPKKWQHQIRLTQTETNLELSQTDFYFVDHRLKNTPLFLLGLDVYEEEMWFNAEKSYREARTNYQIIRKKNGKVYVVRYPSQADWPVIFRKMKLVPSEEELKKLLK